MSLRAPYRRTRNPAIEDDTSSLSFVRRHRAVDVLPCSVEHAVAVGLALGDAARADNASAWGMIPTAGFISFEGA